MKNISMFYSSISVMFLLTLFPTQQPQKLTPKENLIVIKIAAVEINNYYLPCVVVKSE